jgi:iron complex transport system ATP-binding protein
MSLETEALEVRYGDTVAVKPTTTTIRPGEIVGLIGPNGAGKTSLLKALAGIPTASPHVRWQGRSLASFDHAARARSIAYLAQSPEANWPLTVRELVTLGRLPHRHYGQRLDADDVATIERAMRETETASLQDRRIDSLSGGERMRVHLARAFAVDAPALLVDEPVASLDPYHQLAVMRLLGQYRDNGRLVVAVLHDLNLALGACSRLLLMNEGEIVVDGKPDAVINATTLARHYRIRAWLAERDERRIAVPLETLNDHD